MKKIIETSRLYFRCFLPSDAKEMFRLNNDPDVIRYTDDPPFASIQEANAFLLAYDQYEKNGFGRWAVIHKETEEWLGWCGIKRNEEELIDLGYRFHKEHWGKGYATEASVAVRDYAFKTLNISQLIGRVAQENAASIRVLEKIGMQFWKHGPCGHHANALYFHIRRPSPEESLK